jgi:hypothetical protein
MGLSTVAITDHDTVGGVGEALAAASGTSLEVIPGVEISTDVRETEVHILGYFIAVTDANLHHQLQLFKDSRSVRARQIVARLSRLGLSLDFRRVQEMANGGSVGRPHIAGAMVERGYVSSIREAFDRYIGQNRPAYVPRHKIHPAQAIAIIRAAGGVPVLAHPRLLTTRVRYLAANGLAGLEAYYTGYGQEETSSLLSLAQQHQLLATGGSDFHGEHVKPESLLGGVDMPLEVVAALRAYHEKIVSS